MKEKILLLLHRLKIISFDSLTLDMRSRILLNHYDKPKFFITHSLKEERELLRNKVYVIK